MKRRPTLVRLAGLALLAMLLSPAAPIAYAAARPIMINAAPWPVSAPCPAPAGCAIPHAAGVRWGVAGRMPYALRAYNHTPLPPPFPARPIPHPQSVSPCPKSVFLRLTRGVG